MSFLAPEFHRSFTGVFHGVFHGVLEHVEWAGFHAFRRKWATERKHLPAVDVAAAGGWSGTDTLLRCYQQADDVTMLAVILGGGELRERQA
jgi:hypothetical protein